MKIVFLVVLIISTVVYCYSEEIPKYNRAYFGESGWIDADGDCQDTRQEVLIDESIIPVIMTENGCRVVSGLWYSPYDDEYTTDPSKFDIDHMVPLKEAWISGAWKWAEDLRIAYANDLSNSNHLIAVTAKSNRKKSANDSANWMPTNEKYHREYMNNWVQIKLKYNLCFNENEVFGYNELITNDFIFCEE